MVKTKTKPHSGGGDNPPASQQASSSSSSTATATAVASAVAPNLNSTVLTKDGVNTLEHASEAHPVALQVIGLLRYTADQRFLALTRETLAEHDPDVFDIVLTDGTHKRKCVLSTKYNALAKKGGLDGKVISVYECTILHDDTENPVVPVVLLSHFAVHTKSREKLERVAFSKRATEKERLRVPLCGCRRYYLSQFNNDDYFEEDERWKSDGLPMLEEPITKEKLVPLKDVVAGFKEAKLRPLVGRILTRSRLFHFGRKTDTAGAYPMTFSFVICDAETQIELTVWNDLCMDLFENIRIGDLVFVDRYKVSNTKGKPLVWKVNLNPSSPKAVVLNIPDGSVDEKLSERHFPSLEHNFGLHERIRNLADDMLLDAVGVIVYLGREQREQGRVPGVFAEYRWVGVLLKETESPVALKLYTCSAANIFHNLAIGAVLFISKVKVCSHTADSYHRSVFLVTVSTTLIMTWESVKAAEEDVNLPDYLGVVDIAAKHKAMVVGEGGFFEPEVPFTTLAELQAAFGLELTSLDEVKSIADGLELYERRSLLLQGHIAEVQFERQKRHGEGAAAHRDKRRKTDESNLTVVVNALPKTVEVLQASVGKELLLDGQTTDGPTAECPVGITLSHVSGKKVLHAHAAPATMAKIAYNMWVDGFCGIFPESAGFWEALETDTPLESIAAKLKTFKDKKVALLTSFYRPSSTEVEIVFTRVVPLE